MFWRRQRYQPRHLDTGERVQQQLGPATAYPHQAGAYGRPHNQKCDFPLVPPKEAPSLPGGRRRNERSA